MKTDIRTSVPSAIYPDLLRAFPITKPYLKMKWVSQLDADTFLGGDSTDIGVWNSFFKIPDLGYGGQFLVLIVETTTVYEVTLYGGIGFIFSANLFSSATTLLSIESNIIGLGSESDIFESCTGLLTIDLPTLLIAEKRIFKFCTAVTSIDLSSVISFGTDVFQGIVGNTITLIIPASLSTDPNVVALQSNNTVTLILV